MVLVTCHPPREVVWEGSISEMFVRIGVFRISDALLPKPKEHHSHSMDDESP